jgi:hypothetical protein
MKETIPEINLGAEICQSLKRIYYQNDEWIECYEKVALKLSALKLKAKMLNKEKTDIDILMLLRTYSDDDLKDMLD